MTKYTYANITVWLINAIMTIGHIYFYYSISVIWYIIVITSMFVYM